MGRDAFKNHRSRATMLNSMCNVLDAFVSNITICALVDFHISAVLKDNLQQSTEVVIQGCRAAER